MTKVHLDINNSYKQSMLGDIKVNGQLLGRLESSVPEKLEVLSLETIW